VVDVDDDDDGGDDAEEEGLVGLGAGMSKDGRRATWTKAIVPESREMGWFWELRTNRTCRRRKKKIQGKRGKGQLLINRMSNIRIREEKRREKETYKVERQHHTLIQPIL
jgi:hypothetical protein